MLSLGFWEIAVIVVLALVVVGPERLPRVMRYIGRQYGQLRRLADEMRRAMVLEADRQDAEERYQEMQRRREELQRAREEAEAQGGVAQAQRYPSAVPDTDELERAALQAEQDDAGQPADPEPSSDPGGQEHAAEGQDHDPSGLDDAIEAQEVIEPTKTERSVAGE